MPHENHLPRGSSHPQLTPQSLEMITAATIAALNQHPASIGFLPRGAATPLDESISPVAHDASPKPPRTLPHLCAPTPGPVLPSSYSMNNAIHHLRDDRSPDTPSSHVQNRFSYDFVSKLQAEYRTLALAASREFSPFIFLPTRTERRPHNSLFNPCAMPYQEALTWLPVGLGDHEISLTGFRLACTASQTDESLNCTQPRRHAFTTSPRR